MEIELNHFDVSKIILEHINTKKPLSIVRLGDGEMIVVNNDTNRLNNFCINQIGRLISENELCLAKDNLHNSVLNSNILGLPTERHIEKHKLWFSILDYYMDIKAKNHSQWINKKYCSIDLHLDLLFSNEIFEIFQKIDSIVIVSSRDITTKLQDRFKNIHTVEYYSVPGEQMFESVKNDSIDIFERLNDIVVNLKSKDRFGQLLIYGVGPFGKHIGYEFASVGGVSLDLGSVFDFFIGKVTRGWNKGVDSHIEPYL